MKYTTGQGENLNARWIGPTPHKYIRTHPTARLRPALRKRTKHERKWLLLSVFITLGFAYLTWSLVAWVFFLIQGVEYV